MKRTFLTLLLTAIMVLPLFSEAIDYRAEIDKYVKSKQYDKAGQLCEMLLKKMPEDADLMVLYGSILLWGRNYEKSETLFEDVLKIAPDYADAAMGLVRNYLWSENYSKLQSLLERISNTYENDPYTRPVILDAKLKLELYKSSGLSTQKAVKLAEELLKINPNHGAAKGALAGSVSKDVSKLITQAKEEISKNHLKKAMELYAEAYELNRNNFQTAISYARVLSWNRMFDKALIVINPVLDAYPNDTDALNVKARMLAWSDKWKDAEREYINILSINKEDAQAVRGLVDVLRWQNKTKEALTYVERLSRMIPDSEEIEILKAQVMAQGGDRKKAIESLEQHLKKHPDSSVIRAALASEYAGSDRINDAVNELVKSIRLDENNVASYMNLGKLYLYYNKVNEAKALYKTMIEEDENNVPALAGLANAYRFEGNNAKALETYNKALAIDPDYTEAVRGKESILEETDPKLSLNKIFNTYRAKDPDYLFNAKSCCSRTNADYGFHLTPDDRVRARLGFGQIYYYNDDMERYSYNANTDSLELRHSRVWSSRIDSIINLSFNSYKNSGGPLNPLESSKTSADFYSIVQYKGPSVIRQNRNSVTSLSLYKESFIVLRALNSYIENAVNYELSRQEDLKNNISCTFRTGISDYSYNKDNSFYYGIQSVYKSAGFQGFGLEGSYTHETSLTDDSYVMRIFYSKYYHQHKFYFYSHYKYNLDTYYNDYYNQLSSVFSKKIKGALSAALDTSYSLYGKGDTNWYLNLSGSYRL